MEENITLFLGDCLIEMAKIPDNSVDLILCDLPYGVTCCKWDKIIDFEKLWSHYRRIIKKPSGTIILFAQQPFTTKVISSNDKWFKYNIIWKKNNVTGFMNAKHRPLKSTEDICVFSCGNAANRCKNRMTYNPQGLIEINQKVKRYPSEFKKMYLAKNRKRTEIKEYTKTHTNYPTDIIEFDIENDTKHETQKPIKLLEYLVKTYSNENDVVLDNTMGSGTTGIACVNTNRKFIGIEMREDFFELSKNRIFSQISTK